jgi:hypothetical protein
VGGRGAVKRGNFGFEKFPPFLYLLKVGKKKERYFRKKMLENLMEEATYCRNCYHDESAHYWDYEEDENGNEIEDDQPAPCRIPGCKCSLFLVQDEDSLI